MGTDDRPDVKKTPRSITSRLKQERVRQGWSQSELAEHLGTSQVNISRWETGFSSPGPYFRRSLAKLFGKSLEELGFFTEAENESNEEASATSTSSAPLLQSALLPLWNVPHRRNPFFTGREHILTSLYTMFSKNDMAALTQPQAISGLGGIGKTQIAVEYAYRYKDHYQAVLWVTASRDACMAEFAMLASLLDLPEQDEQDQEITVRAVTRWLATHAKWLLILDNADDLEMVTELLPKQAAGNILLTTRLKALGAITYGFEVEKMSMDEGMLFLLRRSKLLALDASLTQSTPEMQADAAKIVIELDALPLALDQAGAYIEEIHCGLPAYLNLYRTRRKELLLRRGRFLTNHPEPVATTWSLSFQQIEQESNAAADLLRLLAFLHPESIPEEILTEGATELGPALAPVAADVLSFNEVLELLLRYSLIWRNSVDRLLSIHRLVQAVLRDGMSYDLQRTWAERAIRALSKAFPVVKITTWEQCRRCLPHVLLSTTYLEEFGLAFAEAADLLNKAATYLAAHAQYAPAQPLLIKALSIRQQVLAPTHPDTALTLNDLGILYLTLGKFQEAEPRLQHALDIRKRILGPEHPDTASSLHNLAKFYYAVGKYSIAGDYYRLALDIRQKTLAQDHPDIAQSLNSLAELYTVQAKFSEALPLYTRALEIQQQALGEDHPDVAETLNNLALLYRSKAEYPEAEKLYKRALSVQEQVLGPDHPDVAQTLNNLARLYRAQGEYAQAEPIYQKAFAIREQVFGHDHPQVAQSLYSLMKLFHSQGKYLQAEEVGQDALKIQERRLGTNHPDIASTLGMLARIYQGQDKQAEAKQLYHRAISIRERMLGSDHPHMALLINSLAEIHQAEGNLVEARRLMKTSIEIRERSLGRGHPYMAYSLSNLAENSFLLGDYVQAEKLHKEALANREQNLGHDHPRTASAYHSLARFYTVLKRYTEAEPLYQKALDIREHILGPEHRAVAVTLEQYAILLHETGREKQAREYEIRARSIHAKQFKPP